MPRLFKNLPSKEIVKFLEQNGFRILHQRGSHITMIFNSGEFSGHVIIPDRKDIPQGTLRNIYEQATTILNDDSLDKYFKNF